MNVKYIIAFILILSGEIISQSDSTFIKPNKIIYNPSYFGTQIEAVTIIAINEIGLSGDYDFYNSMNKKYSFGIRLNIELYKVLDLNVGGGSTYGPYLDYDIFSRFSIRGNFIWFSPLLGFSIHNSMEEYSEFSKLIPKYGFEFKFNVYKSNIGLLLKYVSGTSQRSAYGGIGLSLGFYNY